MSSPLIAWLTREWLTSRNHHGADLAPYPSSEPKRLQLITATGLSTDPDDPLVWCEMTDGECWIDCCVPKGVVDAFNATTSRSFASSSSSKCLFRALSWRFVLARPVVPARSSPSKARPGAAPAAPQRKSPRICLRIEQLQRYAAGDGHCGDSLPFRSAREGKDVSAQERQRAMWVRKIEQGATAPAEVAADAEKVAYVAELPDDPSRRALPSASTSRAAPSAVGPTTGATGTHAPVQPFDPSRQPYQPHPSWPSDTTPVRIDWASARALLDGAGAGEKGKGKERAEQPSAPAPSERRASAALPAGPVKVDWARAQVLIGSVKAATPAHENSRRPEHTEPSAAPGPPAGTKAATPARGAVAAPPSPATAPAPVRTAAASRDAVQRALAGALAASSKRHAPEPAPASVPPPLRPARSRTVSEEEMQAILQRRKAERKRLMGKPLLAPALASASPVASGSGSGSGSAVPSQGRKRPRASAPAEGAPLSSAAEVLLKRVGPSPAKKKKKQKGGTEVERAGSPFAAPAPSASARQPSPTPSILSQAEGPATEADADGDSAMPASSPPPSSPVPSPSPAPAAVLPSSPQPPTPRAPLPTAALPASSPSPSPPTPRRPPPSSTAGAAAAAAAAPPSSTPVRVRSSPRSEAPPPSSGIALDLGEAELSDADDEDREGTPRSLRREDGKGMQRAHADGEVEGVANEQGSAGERQDEGAPLIPLEIWDFNLWLRAKGFEG
ncbi:hypothetical protein JCM10450v2_004578 [Rhodotorula kratochvilovae]